MARTYPRTQRYPLGVDVYIRDAYFPRWPLVLCLKDGTAIHTTNQRTGRTWPAYCHNWDHACRRARVVQLRIDRGLPL